MKFDLARKVRVFNARFEFVEFELHGLFLARKRVPIPSDLMGLAKEPKAQKLLRSSFQLIDENSEISGDRRSTLSTCPVTEQSFDATRKQPSRLQSKRWSGMFIGFSDA
jgi:hypothetical protein